MSRSRRHFGFEPLEKRNLMAFAREGNLMGVKGTSGDDVIRVETINTGSSYYMRLTLNDKHVDYSYDPQDTIILLGKGGNDQITVDDGVRLAVLIDAGSGDDTVITSHGTDGDTYDYADVILGGAGNDTISSGTGDDKIDGGAGNDAIDCGQGNDVAVGGKGNDTIRGGAGDDALIGDAGIDALYGDDGDDALSGGAANDYLDGGDGNDLLRGDKGNDEGHAGAGDDLLLGGAGMDSLFGDEGNDVLDGEAGSDQLHGGTGKDGLFGGAGNDSLFGDNGNDHIDGGIGDDKCLGGDGNDQLKGGLGNDQVDGQNGENLFDSDGELGKDMLANGIEADVDVEVSTAVQGVVATYQVENRGGTVVHTLTIDANNYTGGNWVDTFIDGFYVGMIDGDDITAGNGRLVFSTQPTGDELPFPVDFPGVVAGSRIQVGAWLPQFGYWYTMSSGGFVATYVT
jgi:Ca2+-binding RTX toxin-like protein